MKASLAQLQNRPSALDGTLRVAWIAQRHAVGDYRAEVFTGAASPAFVKAFCAYVELHSLAHTSDEVVNVATRFSRIGAARKGLIEKVVGLNSHWQRRGCQHDAMVECMASPGERLRVHWDIQGP